MTEKSRRHQHHQFQSCIDAEQLLVLKSIQWCIAKNGGGYTQRGVAKGLKVPCLFMITEVSIRCQKNPEVGIRRIPAYTPQYTTGCGNLANCYTLVTYLLTYFLAAHYSYAWLKKIDRRMCPLVKMTMINRFLKVSERQLHYGPRPTI